MGIGDALHAGQVAVADGSGMMAKPVARGLTTDPDMGVIRNVATGFDEARELAVKHGVKVPIGE